MKQLVSGVARWISFSVWLANAITSRSCKTRSDKSRRKERNGKHRCGLGESKFDTPMASTFSRFATPWSRRTHILTSHALRDGYGRFMASAMRRMLARERLAGGNTSTAVLAVEVNELSIQASSPSLRHTLPFALPTTPMFYASSSPAIS